MILVVSGKPVSLAHLAAIKRRVRLELIGGHEKAVEVEFRFGSHCYSRKPKPGETVPADLLVPDGSKEHPRDRIFDELRYEMSKRLVDCIDALIASNSIVTRSQHNNFFHVTLENVEVDGVARSVDYYVFMSAKVVAEPNSPRRIVINVETAYPNVDDEPGPNGKSRRKFGAMLGEEWAPPKR